MRWLALAALVAACDSAEKPSDGTLGTDPPGTTTDPTTPPTDAETGTPGTTPVDADLSALAVPPGGSVANGRFSTSDVCASCHDNAAAADAMRDEDDREIAPYRLWRSAMMANSARDPVWRAQVSAEVAATPPAAGAIEAKCLRCHAPMASGDAELVGDPPPSIATLTDGSERADLALDGVSCTACHQIEDRDLGTDDGFSGGWTILGQERIYGPHTAPFSMPMIQNSGFTPTFSSHVLDPGLCATCHNLEGHTLAADGTETGDAVIEQGMWFEWSASDAAAPGGRTCQSCHLPTTSEDGVPITTAIARSPMGGDFPPVSDRQPYGRHLLVGANTLGPRLFQQFRSVLNPTAPDEAFDATLTAARAQLADRTATLAVTDARRESDRLRADVRVENLAGHKLPSGIPVRRTWLRVTVTDAAGAVVLDQGGWDDRGRLLDAAGGVLDSELAGGPVVGHLDTVGDGQVQVWEGVLAEADGAPTWILTRAAGWAKDDRLLPAGFDVGSPEGARVPPVGTSADPDFGPGGDTVHLDLDASGLTGPLTLTATLVLQPLSARWAEELVASGTPEALALDLMLDTVGNPPETLAVAAANIP